MKKKLVATLCLLSLSAPVIVSAASTGSSKRIDSNHAIIGTLNVSGGSGNAITSWEGHEGKGGHGLYSYIEAVNQYGNKIGSGSEHFNWAAGYDGSQAYASLYNGDAYYFNSRHTTASDSSSIYLQLSRY